VVFGSQIFHWYKKEKDQFPKRKKLILETHLDCQNLVGEIISMDKLYSSDDLLPETKERILEIMELSKQRRKESKQLQKI
jgi:hypothetical protein